MTRDQFIGTWRCKQTTTVMELRPDGTGITRTHIPGRPVFEDRIEWSHTDSTHWYRGTFIEPVPHIPSLENGTVQGEDYTVVAEDATTMSLTEAQDDDIVWVWERTEIPAG